MTTALTTHSANEIAEHVGGELIGPGDIPVTGASDFDESGPGDLTLIGTQGYADKWSDCQAAAALIQRGLEVKSDAGRPLIRVDDADLAFAKTLELFAPPPIQSEAGIHPTAIIHETASFGQGVSVGPYCRIGPGVSIGGQGRLHNNVTVLDHTTIGEDCELWTGVVIRERCTIGDRCIIHPNAVIGADGFGYRPEMTEQGPRIAKIPQIGTVTIGHDVEIGAGATIDRAKCNATVIGDGCKLDNQVQIGHNCRLGKMVIISGCTGVGGSTVIGDGAMIGGMVAIKDHANIGAGAQLAGGAQVATDLAAGGIYAGSPARPIRQTLREIQALKKLPDLLKELRAR